MIVKGLSVFDEYDNDFYTVKPSKKAFKKFLYNIFSIAKRQRMRRLSFLPTCRGYRLGKKQDSLFIEVKKKRLEALQV